MNVRTNKMLLEWHILPEKYFNCQSFVRKNNLRFLRLWSRITDSEKLRLKIDTCCWFIYNQGGEKKKKNNSNVLHIDICVWYFARKISNWPSFAWKISLGSLRLRSFSRHITASQNYCWKCIIFKCLYIIRLEKWKNKQWQFNILTFVSNIVPEKYLNLP